MDIQPNTNQPISDDQELAKVLAGINQQADEAAATPVADSTPMTPPADIAQAPDASASAPSMPDPISTPEPATAPMPDPSAAATPAANGELDAIKQAALGELRPLVDKLDVSDEEKFDTYLLLLRSTDDKALIAPAHEAARGIADEARRAQALLNIIKEIDYLSGAAQTP